jgi:hypothetical protein
MNDRQKKKQQQRWVLKHQDKVSRNTMFKRLKLAGFAGYVYNNILLSHYPLRNVKRIYKSTVRKDFPLMLSFVEDACNYDFDWFDYISKGNKGVHTNGKIKSS